MINIYNVFNYPLFTIRIMEDTEVDIDVALFSDLFGLN